MAGILGSMFPNGFMPSVRNNSDMLMRTGIGLISGRTGPEQAAMGGQAFLDARQGNKTMQFLQSQFPEIAQYVQAGMPMQDALKIAYESKLKAQMPKDPFSTIGKLQADLSAGRISQDQYDQAAAGIGKPGVNVNVNNGQPYPGLSKLGEGFTYRYNQDGTLMTDENGLPMAAAVPGGKADIEAQVSQQKNVEKQSNAATQSDVIISAAKRAREAAGDRDFGHVGQGLVEKMPWTDSAEVARQTQVLKSQATIENLNAMRRQSETGGALGNVTEGEGRMLAAKAGALDPNSPNFARDLDDYELTLLRVVHGYEAGTRIFEQTRGPSAPQQGNGGTTSGGLKWSVSP